MDPAVRIQVDHYFHADPASEQKLDRVITMLSNMSQSLGVILQKEDKIMSIADDLVAEAQAEATIDASILAMVTELQGIVTANANDQPKLQAALAQFKANIAPIAAAIAANTPAGPVVTDPIPTVDPPASDPVPAPAA